MQRGDIDVRDTSGMVTKPPTFTPLFKKRVEASGSEPNSNEVLMPQESPEDVDLPRTYEIGPRLVLPIDERQEGSGGSGSAEPNDVDLPHRIPPNAPPTLVSAERDHESRPPAVPIDPQTRHPDPNQGVSLFVAPRRGGNAALLVPISTPRTIPQTLAVWPEREPLPSLPPANAPAAPVSAGRRPIDVAPPAGAARPTASSLRSAEDYANEVEAENEDERLFRTLATKPPGDLNGFGHPPSPAPPGHRIPQQNGGHTAPPAFEPDGPPGIGLASSPPGFTPENLLPTTARPSITTTTPYFTEKLVPRRPPNPKEEYAARTPATTQAPPVSSPPARTTVAEYGAAASGGEYVDQNVHHGNFGREPTTSIAFNPNVAVPLSVAQFGPPQNATGGFSFIAPEQPSLIKQPDPRLKNFDPPPGRGFASQSVNPRSKAAYFFVPPPVKLSMSKAVQLHPFKNKLPTVHTPRALLQNAVPTIPPPLFRPPAFAIPPPTAAPSRLLKFRNDQRPAGFNMRGDQLNWTPIGLAAPKRLGAVKLVPADANEENTQVEVEAFDDHDAQRDDQICHPDLQDDFSDLKAEDRPHIRRCFRRARNCLLNEAALPLERRVGYSEEQCVNFCGHHPFCRALVYSSVMRMCDVFDQRNGTANAKAIAYAGVSYYEPLNSKAIECWKSRLNENFFTNDKDNGAQSDEQRRSNGSSPVVIAPRDHCENEQDVVVLKSVGFRLRNFGVVPLLQNSSETECVFSCLVNLARGHIPFHCSSTTYSRRNSCLIYREVKNVRGNGHLIAESGFTHYEKSCVSQNLVDLCRGYPIIRQPQHTLLGFSKQALRADSLVECLELCYADWLATRDCRSVMYFYEERTDNCVLNTQSRTSAPQFFVSEADELVDYASFESCLHDAELPRRASGHVRRYELKVPPRVANRPFMPHAIPPPVGAPFQVGAVGGVTSKRKLQETTHVYTSTRVTRPPPQYYGSVFRPTPAPDSSESRERNTYVVDEQGAKRPGERRRSGRRRSSKVAVHKFLVNSEETPRKMRPNGEFVLSAERFHHRLSQLLSDSIRPLQPQRPS
ncbi:PAN domain containing protein [Aphelenchoides fujianensis]|nr:PAN domain containing protein [Aphelenchoides fujianensis]